MKKKKRIPKCCICQVNKVGKGLGRMTCNKGDCQKIFWSRIKIISEHGMRALLCSMIYQFVEDLKKTGLILSNEKLMKNKSKKSRNVIITKHEKAKEFLLSIDEPLSMKNICDFLGIDRRKILKQFFATRFIQS